MDPDRRAAVGEAVEGEEPSAGKDRVGGVERNFGADLTAADQRPAAALEGLARGGVLQAGAGADGQAGGVEAAAGAEGELDPLQLRWRVRLRSPRTVPLSSSETGAGRSRGSSRGEILPSKETTTSGAADLLGAAAGAAAMASRAIAAARSGMGRRRLIRISRT